MVTHKQQNDLLVGPKTTLWILAISVVICVIAGILAQRTHQSNTAQGVDSYPGVVDQGQMGPTTQAQQSQMYELREQSGAGASGSANGAAPMAK